MITYNSQDQNIIIMKKDNKSRDIKTTINKRDEEDNLNKRV